MAAVACRGRIRGLVVSCLLLAIGFAGCEKNPYTGRSQLLMTSVGEEMEMGAQA